MTEMGHAGGMEASQKLVQTSLVQILDVKLSRKLALPLQTWPCARML